MEGWRGWRKDRNTEGREKGREIRGMYGENGGRKAWREGRKEGKEERREVGLGKGLEKG